MKINWSKTFLYLAWLQALLAMLLSLYASEILHWAPCSLCWYQRIFMYPLVFIIAVGIITKDKNLPLYVLPLSITGGLIALYHELLLIGVITENAVPCSFGVSCLTKYGDFLGFITIPFLSLLAFIFITIMMLLFQRSQKK